MSRFLGLKVKDGEKPFSLLDFLIHWLINTAGFTLFAHEYGHLIGARLIGMEAQIRSTNLTSVYPDPTRFPLTNLEHLIFYGSGGFFQCIFYTIKNYRNNDREQRLVNWMVAVHGLIYGIFEAMTPKAMWGFGGLLASMVGFWIFIMFLIWRKPEIIA